MAHLTTYFSWKAHPPSADFLHSCVESPAKPEVLLVELLPVDGGGEPLIGGDSHEKLCKSIADRIHGTIVYLPTFIYYQKSTKCR